MKHSVANDPSQQAVKLVAVGPRFFEQYCFGFSLGDHWLKCLIFQTNEEGFTFDTFKTDVSIKWMLV